MAGIPCEHLQANYSKTEHCVGTWIDNKLLYEQTLEITGGSSTSAWNVTDISSDVGSVDKIMKCEVFGIRSSDNNIIDSEFFYNTTDFFMALVQKTSSGASIRYMSSILYAKLYVTVRYTKSSP